MKEIFISYLNWNSLQPALEMIASKGIFISLIITGAIISHYLTKKIIISALHKVIRKTKTQWDDIFIQNNVFNYISLIAPITFIYISSDLIFTHSIIMLKMIKLISISLIVLITSFEINAILNSVNILLKEKMIKKSIPIQSYIQVVKLVIYFLTGIFIISILLQKSPWVFLSGLGAMTALLLLIFKDTILSFVAGIQLSAYNLVKEGDWIEIPSYNADGDVIDVSLNTIKVQNWDKTITSIPVYALTSNGFKNWRGMSESGGRRIKKSIAIDMTSVRFCTADDFHSWKSHNQVSRNLEHVNLDSNQTNLGVFRSYLKSYLKEHPHIHNGMTCLVRYLQPSEKGLPLEIYIFSSDQDWGNFEEIQANIIDHILATLPFFNLAVFQAPSGKDIQEITQK